VGAFGALELGDLERLLWFVERGRAQGLLEGLGGARKLIATTIPEELRVEDRSRRAREARATAELRRAVSDGDLNAARARRAELDEATAEVREIADRIQREAKRGAGLVYPRARSTAQVRAALSEGEALVEYASLGPVDVALVIERAGVRVVRLGDPEATDRAAAPLRTPNRAQPAPHDFAASRATLVEPLALASDVRRVLVSPDGSLTCTPLAALFGDREVAYVPSGTVLSMLREERPSEGAAVLAVGDPNYDLAAESGQRGPAKGRRFARLPKTLEEARAVGDLVLVGDDATEAGLARALRTRPRWLAVHFACHGVVDPERPSQSAVVITPDPENDGFLTALEILRIPVAADLVVLSACETGTGRIARSEGLVGLARAFMYAGASRVLCSLWKVDDEATRALMVKFYEVWSPRSRESAPEDASKAGSPRDGSAVARGRGLSAAAALREAQAFVRSHPKWEHPYYWAAWVLWGLP
jgi:CHAT domain-containing protein